MQVINYSLIPKVFFNTGYMAVILGPPRLLGLGVLVIAKELAPKKPKPRRHRYRKLFSVINK